MPCLVVLLAALAPRVVSVVLWLFTNFFDRAFAGRQILLLVGVILLPFTTLAYAWAINTNGSIDGMWIVILIIAVLIDISAFEGGRRHRR
jgi:hypothetical protein